MFSSLLNSDYKLISNGLTKPYWRVWCGKRIMSFSVVTKIVIHAMCSLLHTFNKNINVSADQRIPERMFLLVIEYSQAPGSLMEAELINLPFVRSIHCQWRFLHHLHIITTSKTTIVKNILTLFLAEEHPEIRREGLKK